jgi:hypothetical protein
MRTWATKKPDWLLDSQKLVREMEHVKPLGRDTVVRHNPEPNFRIASYGVRARKLSNRTDGRVFGDFKRWVRKQTRLADEV